MSGRSLSYRLARQIFREVQRSAPTQMQPRPRNHHLNRHIRRGLYEMDGTTNERCAGNMKMEPPSSDKMGPFLTNQKFWHEVHERYYADIKEKSVEDTAIEVLCKLPHDPNVDLLVTDKIEDKL